MHTLSAAVRVFVLQTLIAFAMFFYRMFRQNHLIFSGKKTEALCAENHELKGVPELGRDDDECPAIVCVGPGA